MTGCAFFIYTENREVCTVGKKNFGSVFSGFVRKVDIALINNLIIVVLLAFGAYGFASLKKVKISVICIALICVITVFNVFLRILKRKKMVRVARSFGLSVKGKTLSGGLVGAFQLPIFVLRDDGKPIWYNREFEAVCTGSGEDGSSVMQTLFKKHIEGRLGEDAKELSCDVEIGNGCYRMYCNVTLGGELCASGIAYSVYLVDISGTERLRKLYCDRRIAIGEIVIDNYDEIFQADGESVMNRILVELSHIFDDWLKGKDAFVRRMIRERYIFLVEERYLEQLEAEHFAILERVKKISKGNTIPVTLSIGISTNRANLNTAAFDALCSGDSETPEVKKAFADTIAGHFARAEELLNFALGRGGDQAIVQFGDDSRESNFFGGSEIDIDRKDKVKARVVANIMRREILSANRVLIMGHSSADLDALGAALAVYRIAETLGKEAYVILERPNSQISVMYESLMRSGNYHDVFIRKNEALNILDDRTFVVLVDTFSAKQSEAPEVIENAKRIAVIDHHRRGVDYIRDTIFTYTETSASSSSELVIEIMRYISPKMTMPLLEAETLYGGILIDTKNMFFKTGKRTFEAASFLRGLGVSPIAVRKYIQPDYEAFLKINQIVSGLQFMRVNAGRIKRGIAIASCELSSDEANTVAPMAADKMLEIAGVDASFVVIQLDAGVSIKARSLGEINVQIILERPEIGGGGHFNAAGGFIKGAKAKDVVKLITDIVSMDESFVQTEET